MATTCEKCRKQIGYFSIGNVEGKTYCPECSKIVKEENGEQPGERPKVRTVLMVVSLLIYATCILFLLWGTDEFGPESELSPRIEKFTVDLAVILVIGGAAPFGGLIYTLLCKIIPEKKP